METETLTKEGLEVYEKYDVWQISPEKDRAYFATPGICISIRFYPREDGMNTNWWDKFVAEVQYDYRNPDVIDSFDFVQHSGTYGQHLFFNTLKQAIKGCEEFINQDFEGVSDFGSNDKILSTTKISRKEVAKKAFFHHYGMFPDLHEFRTKACNNSKYFQEYVHYRDRYKRRAESDKKYQLKIDKVFLEEFGFSVEKIQYNWRINVYDFLEKIGKPEANRDVLKKELSKRQFSVFDKVFNYYKV